MLNRNELIDWLMTALGEMNVPVGDHEAPPQGGWSEGQPNVSEFQPYVVLTTGTATSQQGSLCPQYWDWQAGFGVTCHAVTRFACDDLSMRTLVALSGLPRWEFGVYRVNQVKVDALGPIQHNRSTSPHFWSARHTLTVAVTRLRVS